MGRVRGAVRAVGLRPRRHGRHHAGPRRSRAPSRRRDPARRSRGVRPRRRRAGDRRAARGRRGDRRARRALQRRSQASLLGFLAPGDLPAAIRRKVQGIDMRGSMARVHLLVDELPSYIGFDGPAEGPQHRRHQLLGATVQNFEIGSEAMRRRELPSEFVIEAVIQSTTRPVAVDARAPHADARRPAASLRHRGRVGRSQGGVHRARPRRPGGVRAGHPRACPRSSLTITPLDIEREYGLTEGNIFHGAMFLDQLFGSRPIPRAVGLPHAGRRLLPLRLGHPPGRRRHGRVGPATRRTSRWRASRRWRRCARRRREPQRPHARAPRHGHRRRPPHRLCARAPRGPSGPSRASRRADADQALSRRGA